MPIPPTRVNVNRPNGNSSQQNSSPGTVHVARVAEYRRVYQSFHIHNRVSMSTASSSGPVCWPESEGSMSSKDPGMVLYGRIRMLRGANLQATKNEIDWLRARLAALSNVDHSRSRRAKAAMIQVGNMWWNKCRHVLDASPESMEPTTAELQKDINKIWADMYTIMTDVMLLEQMFKKP
ncbi:hypothetical protein MCOR31_011441 [Pyricularia oryzae]|nr:hypothetical protein MCOR26_002945 [Pyricularia oryzae]KAI6339720.1 hypothetical protein MCOR30_002713 [Pyricularia oryzae]KAI6354561.1 hypothetical protein MCOR31_011441 [Pyricularia oryzae]KAI6391477.1 hypothetical protein MCOR24_010125 [Pyricularia oryzae]KAI6579922.1 hypothetical protein MCOR06_009835 [Pyricularia oryzae]